MLSSSKNGDEDRRTDVLNKYKDYTAYDYPIQEEDEESKDDLFSRMGSGEMYNKIVNGQSESSGEYSMSGYTMQFKNNTSRDDLGVINEEDFGSFTLVNI
mmetsp:Transcript_22048/g.24517  ORF Transcript_22048/g.24517 Transcript_22048/m.24517 type:complete len:100 (+) Transcript_22048:84-383(+)|eukprot:CAMPEP_0205808106 /NCGR_PEP_ID=MMETSP0205-20121125/11973_1 /ASSEMBLY_ACC=CAM_ASM_000278 /TAXON_ID=36767 /ORGANISM="Euplotes focardii, Strain TN1" /LENGTH=99 /DNA_ID=CAMNT_0053083279 /DNA_START=302 /DNA_END=601 /DNA_ORIENTATION=-